MNMNLHEYFLEPQNTQNNTEVNASILSIPCVPWLENISSLSTHSSELALDVMAEKLKEIQR